MQKISNPDIQNKIDLTKPPRGTRDLIGRDYLIYRQFISNFDQTMYLHGFDGIEPSILEHKELYYNTAGETSDIVSKELFLVQPINKESSRHTVLRAEGTLSVIRSLIAGGKIDEKNLRLYYSGPMFRYCRPQKGRFRQFYQLGGEIINSDDPKHDIEVIKLSAEWLNQYCKPVLHINTLGDQESLLRYIEVLKQFLFKKHECLSAINQERLSTNVMRVLDQLSENEKEALGEDFPDIYDYLNKNELDRFEFIISELSKCNISVNRDRYLVRGLDYYRHTVFEFIHDQQAVGGGGRYIFNRTRFDGGKSVVSGAGFGIGLDRICPFGQDIDELTLCIIHGDSYQYSVEIGQKVIQTGLRYKLIYGDIKNCFKIASKSHAKWIITYTTEDIIKKMVHVKNQDEKKYISLHSISTCLMN